MRIGIIADTHDRLPLIDKAVQKLNEEEVELVLHAGDFIAPFVASNFRPLKAKMIGVFGNNDAEKDLLRREFDAIGAQIRGRFAQITVNHLKIALLHGEEMSLLEALINTDSYDVVVYGHTHQAEVHRVGNTLVVNPGEVCGYLSDRATIAFLDSETSDVLVISL
ncbi:MAG: metallophosphoesterase [Candidatus Bathyarchaeota archaeon]|nr:metallophosphoesterase [Candidatus Bathyarchaeota archaeon]